MQVVVKNGEFKFTKQQNTLLNIIILIIFFLFIITEPSSGFSCSTCRKRCDSAWILVQHVQQMHGVRIYADGNNHLSPTQQAAASIQFQNLAAAAAAARSGNGIRANLPPGLENNPHFGLLKSFNQGLNGGNNFLPTSRPSSNSSHHDFRVDQLMGMNPHLGLPNPFVERPPTSLFGHHAAAAALNSETAAATAAANMDFYSQRLKQLAGAGQTHPLGNGSTSRLVVEN